jgi:RNA polymerase sigma factor (sigma-70 family)
MMKELAPAEQYLLDEIRRGSETGWTQLVDRYQGRLLAFARSKLRPAAEAEDLVQETFISFLKSLGTYRGEASLETYLFLILRRKIIDHGRGRKQSVCLLQDLYPSRGDEESGPSALDQVESRDLTASRYARQNESLAARKEVLADALRGVFDAVKKKLHFRDLQILEMIFFGRLRNKDIAEVLAMEETQVGLVKHRYLKQIQEATARALGSDRDDDLPIADSVLGEIWSERRLSCLKRSTIGSYLLGTLDPAWQEHVRFHLDRLGCPFCRANLEDLQRQSAADRNIILKNQILQSTIGFLKSNPITS